MHGPFELSVSLSRILGCWIVVRMECIGTFKISTNQQVKFAPAPAVFRALSPPTDQYAAMKAAEGAVEAAPRPALIAIQQPSGTRTEYVAV